MTRLRAAPDLAARLGKGVMVMRRRLVRLRRKGLLAPVLDSMTRVRVQRWNIAAPQWGTRPVLRIGIISDIHLGFAPMSPARLATALRRIRALQPDMIVFLGDLAGGYGTKNRNKNLAEAVQAIGPLSAPNGKFAVLGNHDWRDDPDAQSRESPPVAATKQLREVGYHVLQNEACRPEGRDDVWIVGLDSQRGFRRLGPTGFQFSGNDDLDLAMKGVKGDDPVILLAHEPDIFPDLTDDRIAITLSGHTHGGQIRLFGRAFVAPSRHGTRYAYGHFKDGARQLVVSGGLGATSIPLRVGATPEITMVHVGPE